MNLGRRLSLAPPQPAEKVDATRQAWVCGGLRRLYRVTDGTHDYGEWDNEIHARMFLTLLLEGNPETLRPL